MDAATCHRQREHVSGALGETPAAVWLPHALQPGYDGVIAVRATALTAHKEQ
jgi:hypothetical protein